jgi:hypothetical protein
VGSGLEEEDREEGDGYVVIQRDEVLDDAHEQVVGDVAEAAVEETVHCHTSDDSEGCSGDGLRLVVEVASSDGCDGVYKAYGDQGGDIFVPAEEEMGVVACSEEVGVGHDGPSSVVCAQESSEVPVDEEGRGEGDEIWKEAHCQLEAQLMLGAEGKEYVEVEDLAPQIHAYGSEEEYLGYCAGSSEACEEQEESPVLESKAHDWPQDAGDVVVCGALEHLCGRVLSGVTEECMLCGKEETNICCFALDGDE